MKKLGFISLFFFFALQVSAQINIQNSGWFMAVNNTKFNSKWGMHFDFQLRSADNWSYVRNILIRPGVTYFINDKSNITAGYLYTTTETRAFNEVVASTHENRIWEQYIFTHKLKAAFVTHRARLEQRFIEQTVGEDMFAQRFRYFFRVLQPLANYKDSFTQGAFLAVQNEVFLNVQHKDELNGSLFDQNRFYIAGGYRVSKHLDIEVGYLNQYLNGASVNTSNRVAQLAIYTRF